MNFITDSLTNYNVGLKNRPLESNVFKVFSKCLTHGVHVKIEIWTNWVEWVHPAEESIVPVVGVCQSNDAAGDWSASVAGNEADWAVSPSEVIFTFLQLEIK